MGLENSVKLMTLPLFIVFDLLKDEIDEKDVEGSEFKFLFSDV